MIKFDLICDKGHDFETWFKSSDAFDELRLAKLVTCAICGSSHVEKALMAPSVRPSRSAGEKPQLSGPRNDVEAAMAEMRRQVEENSDYVGMNFAAEARRMHAGEIDERSIYGEARSDEARALLEDGIPVAPLPFIPKRQVS